MQDFDRQGMLESYIYEMNQLLIGLEGIIVQVEDIIEDEDINEIFRIMHTIKGSSAMMEYNDLSNIAHVIEDLFFYIRDRNPVIDDYNKIVDLTLEVVDFVKEEVGKMEMGEDVDGDPSEIKEKITAYLNELKVLNGDLDKEEIKETKTQIIDCGKKVNEEPKGLRYYGTVFFEAGSEMENVRAYTVFHNIKEIGTDIYYKPEDLLDDESIEIIRKNGFYIEFNSEKSLEEVENAFMKSLFIKELNLDYEKGEIKNYNSIVKFNDDAEMENVRAYGLVHKLEEEGIVVTTEPENILDEKSLDIIKKDGVKLIIRTDKSYNEIEKIIENTIYLKSFELKEEIKDKKEEIVEKDKKKVKEKKERTQSLKREPIQSAISVGVDKLDLLLNLVGELVTSEAMVTQNPELEGLNLDSFKKEAAQHRKIIKDVQDTVMSMRMVPLSPTFFRMHRIVRDMTRQLNKEVDFEIKGENTEVDRNIIEHINDPLMHIIRNSIDHGIELPEERIKKGKNPCGKVILEAKNTGGDVLITVTDDGAGFNRDKILKKAEKLEMLTKPVDEYTDREIYNFVLAPGFSTNEAVTSYSGRGVGMDVVTNNIEQVGGTVLVDSKPNNGSEFTLKIPLTLAIIEGMIIRLGDVKYTIPIASIVRSFVGKEEDLLVDPSGNEMIMVRGNTYNLVRLKEEFELDYGCDNIEDGIVIMLESGEEIVCIFTDELIGEQQVVVKGIPRYIKKPRGISNCTLLGNGEISLIIDVAGFFDN